MEFVTEYYPYWKAILWCFYPIGALVMIELFFRLANNDDDDDQGGGMMVPVMLPTR